MRKAFFLPRRPGFRRETHLVAETFLAGDRLVRVAPLPTANDQETPTVPRRAPRASRRIPIPFLSTRLPTKTIPASELRRPSDNRATSRHSPRRDP